MLVHIPASLRSYWGGGARHETDAGTLAEALATLGPLSSRVLDDAGAVRRHVHVFVNHQQATLDRPLRDGDVIHILPAVSGGSACP